MVLTCGQKPKLCPKPAYFCFRLLNFFPTLYNVATLRFTSATNLSRCKESSFALTVISKWWWVAEWKVVASRRLLGRRRWKFSIFSFKIQRVEGAPYTSCNVSRLYTCIVLLLLLLFNFIVNARGRVGPDFRLSLLLGSRRITLEFY